MPTDKNAGDRSTVRHLIGPLAFACAALLCTMTCTVAFAAAVAQPFAIISPQRAEALKHSTHRTRPAALRFGEQARERRAHPMPRLQIEGTLPHHGEYDESVEAVKDFAAARDLALAGRISGDSVKQKKAAQIISAWLSVYRPTYNPIDETQLDGLFMAYDLLPSEIRAPLVKPMNRFSRELAEGYLERIPTLRGKTATNNWQSHRVKLVTLAAYLLGDERLIAQARSAYKEQIAANIRPDGSTVDFAERDAIHYVCYDLEPLAVAALAAREHGEDWYRLKNPAGVGLEDALLWLKRYADGGATHEEFVRSKVEFDAERRRAGVKGFSGRFDPKDARGVMMFAARLDPRFIPTTRKLGWSMPLCDLVWPLEE